MHNGPLNRGVHHQTQKTSSKQKSTERPLLRSRGRFSDIPVLLNGVEAGTLLDALPAIHLAVVVLIRADVPVSEDTGSGVAAVYLS